MALSTISLDKNAVEAAANLINKHIFQTPLIYSSSLSRRFDAHIYLKLENLQKTGSFKIRGATCKLLSGLARGTITEKGVVAASAGNHAQGVALAATAAGLPAVIVMPQWASISKQEATRNYGGRIVIYGNTVEESLSKARSMADQGMTFIHPFDDPDLIAGQATIGLEIMAALPQADTVVVPVGGGGLIAGVASLVKFVRPSTRVVGVEASACPSAQAAMAAGKVVPVAAKSSIADGISVKQLGEIPFQIMQQTVSDVVTVQEAHIAAAIQTLLERKKVLTEGAGAAPLAALLSGTVCPSRGETVVLVISGGNVDSPLLGRIIHRGLVENGRIMRIQLTLIDKPGTLAGLLNLVAGHDANILHIYHDRGEALRAIDQTRVTLELETRNTEHISRIADALDQAGYEMAPIACRVK